jgi:hypothetical protein
MKAFVRGSSMIATVVLLAGASGVGRFSGHFSGYYAQAHWTTFLSGNPSYQNTAFNYTGNAPQSVEVTRAALSARGRAINPIPVSSVYPSRESVAHHNKVAAIESSKEQ